MADNLCDYPVGEDKTCDRPLCDEHSFTIGTDIHYCKDHAAQWQKWNKEVTDKTIRIDEHS